MFRGLITSWSYALDDAGYSSKDDFDLLLLRADISGARQGDNVADDGHELLVVVGTSFSEPVLPGAADEARAARLQAWRGRAGAASRCPDRVRGPRRSIRRSTMIH